MRASGRPSACLQHRCFAMLLDACQLTCKQLYAGLWGGGFCVQMGSKMESKWLPHGSPEPLGASWPPESLLERSRRLLERSRRLLGTLLDGSKTERKSSWSALGRSKTDFESGFSHLGGQKAPEKEAKRVPNRIQVAIRAESGETSFSGNSSMNFNDFGGPGVSFWRSKSI